MDKANAVFCKPLWVCDGEQDLTPGERSGRYVMVFYTQQEAEADAIAGDEGWEWNEEPAKQTEIVELMRECRDEGWAGAVLTKPDGEELYYESRHAVFPLSKLLVHWVWKRTI